MRYITVALLVLLALVHAELWFGRGGAPRMMELQGRLREQQVANGTARARNGQMDAEVRDLKEGLEMVEEKARYELGMIRPNEIYVQVSTPRPATPAPPATR